MKTEIEFPLSLTLVAGGIGSGKSVVSRILRAKGLPVYDCDSEAKRIMDTDSAIHRRLREYIHPRAVVGGVIDRALISDIVFADNEAMRRLNGIVHGAVIEDLARWSKGNALEGKLCFAECAIPVSSGLVHYINNIWEVTAPQDVRIKRVMTRNKMKEELVVQRIMAQRGECLEHVAHEKIINDNIVAVLPQVNFLLEKAAININTLIQA